MRINWKVRFKHKAFLIALFSLLLLFIQQVAAIFGVDTTIYNDQITDLFNTILAILVLLGIVTDPTTASISDSGQALKYEKPKGDGKR